MTDHAAIVPTEMGPVGTIVSVPEGSAREAVIMMGAPGGPCRAGVNAVWARLARELAQRRIAVLRFDLAAEGESLLAGENLTRDPGWHQEANLAILRDVAPWFRDRAGVGKLILVGICHGGRLALEFGAGDSQVKGSFLVVPYLWSVPPAMLPAKQELHRRGLPHASELFDRGSSDVGAQEGGGEAIEARSDKVPLTLEMIDTCRRALRGGPIWMLIGEGDSQKPVELKERLGADGERLTVEIAPGMIIHPVTHPEVEQLVSSKLIERLTEATRRRVDAAGARAAETPLARNAAKR